MTHNKIN